MHIALHSPWRKVAFLGTSLLLCTAYLSYSTREFLSAHFSEQANLPSLEQAVALEPTNASYWNLLGRYHLFVNQEPLAAVPLLQSAVKLNPHRADYWVDLSIAYQLLGQSEQQIVAIQNAISAEPRTPEVNWQAANLYWAIGDAETALHEFGIVALSDASLLAPTLESCWRIRPDANALLDHVLPVRADVYSGFLEFLISKNEAVGSAAVWERLAQLHSPVGTRYVFGYIHYLIGRGDVAQAARVWRDAASMAGLSAYQPSAENLVVDGDFSLPVLNGGFDWLYQTMPGVTLAIDPAERHSGQQSLSIAYYSTGLEDTGIQQLIPVEADSEYDFSAYFKSENLEGAGGPEFLLQDAFRGITYFSSAELKDSELWKQVSGTFRTSAESKLLLLRVARIPAYNAIRGRLWIDGVRLIKNRAAAGAE